MNSETKIIFNKLYVKQWVLGLIHADIREIIRTKIFIQDIAWIPLNLIDRFYGDPFLLRSEEGNLNIIFEDFSFDENYGNISMMTLDKNFKKIRQKVLIDTKSHLSYPFIFKEKDTIYVFPESAHNGNLSCYEYDPVNETLTFVKSVIHLPLLDSTILKKDGKYWIFGTLNEKPSGYRLHLFHSNNLLGPYIPHTGNPVKIGYNGTRSSGDFIHVDGNIYRPTQNCENAYGESMTINRIKQLDEHNFEEEPYMDITIDKRNLDVNGIHTIHTINVLDGIIAVDGMKWTFSLKNQIRNFLRNRKHLRNIRRQQAV